MNNWFLRYKYVFWVDNGLLYVPHLNKNVENVGHITLVYTHKKCVIIYIYIYIHTYIHTHITHNIFIFITCKKIRYEVKQPTTCTGVFCF